MRQKSLLVLVVALLLACSGNYYVPHNHTIEADVEAFRAESAAYLASVRKAILAHASKPPIMSIYEAMAVPPEPTSVLDPDFYLEAYEKIDALVVRAASVAQNHKTIKMLYSLQPTFKNIEYHEGKWMKVMHLDMMAMVLDGQFKTILDLERSKKDR